MDYNGGNNVALEPSLVIEGMRFVDANAVFSHSFQSRAPSTKICRYACTDTFRRLVRSEEYKKGQKRIIENSSVALNSAMAI